MTLSNTGSVLATLTQLTQLNRTSVLASKVKDASFPEFICLLDFITAEFQQFLRALEMINHEALETMLEQVMDAFTLKIGQILQADRTTIFLVDTDKGQLWGKLPQNNTNTDREIRIPLNLGLVGHVATTGESLNIPDAYNHPLFNQEVDERPGYHTNSLLCLPIVNSSKKVVAVVQLLNKAGGVPFDNKDEESFRDIANSIGIILETCQSFYMAARNQRGAAALLKATQYLGQSLDLEATLRLVMDQARELMQADRSTLFMLSRQRGELWSKVATADGETVMEIRIPANRGIAGYVASTGQLLNIPDAYKDPRFDPSTDQKTGYVTRNILCMPVFNSEGQLIGVTQLINKNQGSFTNSDEEFMRAFNIQAGIALENAKLFENVLLEKQYQKDILQSLSDAVISTDMQGRIVTINDAALGLLGFPLHQVDGKNRQLWEGKLLGRYVWDVVPIDSLKGRLQESLTTGNKYYLPEQNLTIGLAKCPMNEVVNEQDKRTNSSLRLSEKRDEAFSDENSLYILAIPKSDDPNIYIPWNEIAWNLQTSTYLDKKSVQEIERSINLTVNPLTNPQGKVRGGLVVLEDISREKRLKTTMYRYLTPGVAEQVLALGKDALMEGSKKDVTILFSDIRGYTTLTENLGASEVVSLLNKYFETMVEAVFNHEGTLDKFIGDALMAVFGAPLPLKENHGWMAVKSALDMRWRLLEFNKPRLLNNQPLIHIGIGISSGEVVSGNIGSQKRMDYTVIGDGVNLSARLESVTKEYGCDIILSEFTYNLCRDRIFVRELDKIRVKGKNQAVSIYELIGEVDTPLNDVTQKSLELYAAGRKAYINRDFARAITYFEEARQLKPRDQPILIHLERSKNYLDNPPPDFWDGVHTMTTK
ncbi:MAG TPA: adenylate/guanylate cyclase domain-containing protein [Cyanobacteria bacterium UBA11149]|nr:adenylate/guanylate cyclase domain-containing protein [Cyanobacteria bacterium UBA11367]HBE58875.1 adenylate/guanylate cyclase domain-containing protein [Cyanobacteria bacterium UBA11366]HBK62520.1 adenylate/guanylate cyclase domain-containing protein [Cyanobacteria bacterium UBA11166]HBR75826.1 adenylate/guanylate cyclase domain-containing protein [Cyanobacteria bacterium UBA11159]HBS72311.1 adenylate/guanylate cyclase domain-containing protein [Cyanobacteria bacterium UBA11153]HBW91145.1 